MSRLVSVLAGLAAGVWLTIILGEPTLGAIVGSYVLLLFELPRNGAEKRRLRNVINGQYLRLKNTNSQIGRLGPAPISVHDRKSLQGPLRPYEHRV